jgi:hypothetical protein
VPWGGSYNAYVDKFVSRVDWVVPDILELEAPKQSLVNSLESRLSGSSDNRDLDA